jgi:type IV pilus assembly protein PilV
MSALRHVCATRRRTMPRRRARSAASAGFSLVEVMVALVVCAIGLLGLAKMESLSIASTGVASMRSLAAIQASSLAAAMHANRAYWAAGLALATTTVKATPAGGVSIPNNADLSTPASCLVPGANACTPSLMAAYDVQQWGAALQTLLPGSTSTISCTTNATPVTCTIEIQWVEKAIAANAQQTNIGSLAAPTYILYVEP